MIGVGTLTVLLSAAAAAPDVETESFTLETATALALTFANEMIQAREDLVLVDADYLTAISAIVPRVGLSTQIGFIQNSQPSIVAGGRVVSDSSPLYAFNLSARQLIADGGRWWTVFGQVSDNREAKEADLQAVKNLVRAAAAQTFFGLERARQAQQAIEAQVDFAKAQVERAQGLFRVGRGAPADVAVARRNLASDQIQLLDADTAEGQALRMFNVRVGRRPWAPAVLVMPARVRTATVVARFVPALDRLEALVIEHRPELASLRAQMQAAEKGVVIARSGYWPRIDVGASYNRNDPNPRTVFGDPSNNFTAFMDLSLQYDFLQQSVAATAEVERAEVQLRKLRATFSLQRNQALSEMQDAVQRVRNLERSSRFALVQISAAEEAVRAARGLYEAGRGNSLELRDAELGLTRARIDAINARLDAEVAYADLVRFVGSDEWAVR